MNRPKLFRGLRITWSVAWGVVAVLLCVLWVRSYRYTDMGVAKLYVRTLSFNSHQGRILFASLVIDGETSVKFHSIPKSEWSPARWAHEDARGFVVFRPDIIWLVVSHWFAVLFAGMLTIVPWISQHSWRFSLRTLLIATTLISVALGLIVWAVRAG